MMIGVIVIAIVYYDGDCGYCNRAVMWLIHHKISHRFQFAQLESSYGDHLFEARHDLQNIDSIIVVDGDKVWIKSNAIIHLLGQIKGYQFLGWTLKWIPKFVRDIGYDAFAKIRHKVILKNACRLPTPEERKYFLN